MSSTVAAGRAQIVLGALLVQFSVIGCVFAYGVFFPALEAEFGWSRTLLSACSSLSFFVMGSLAIVAGRSSDRYGPRIVLMISGLVFGLAYTALSQISAPWHLFLLYGLLIGIGLSTHDVVTLSTIARWFPEKRGLMTGVAKAGTAAGQLLLPLSASVLIANLGWRAAFVVLGLVVTGLLLLAAALIREAPTAPEAPDDSSTGDEALERVASGQPPLRFAQIWPTRQFQTFCAIQFVFFPSLMTVPVHIVVHGVDLGMTPTAAAGVLATMGGVSVFGRVMLGATVDRLGGRNGLLICFGLLLGSLLILIFARQGWLLYAFAMIYGLAHGGFFTVVSPALAEYFGIAALGTVFGTVLFFGTLGGSLGPLLAGWMFDSTGSYTLAFGILAALAAVGLGLVISLRPPRFA